MSPALPRRLARGTIRLANWMVDGAVLAAVALIILFALFAVFDDNRVYGNAETTVFEQYRPQPDDTVSFDELRSRNADVLGWITVYGTGIDYPLVQGVDNDVYINTSALGEPALSGAIFLDWRNAPDFSDPSTIIYGHHMEHSLMFGDLDRFADADYLGQHRYGNLYYGGQDHGIEVLGYLKADSYDTVVYSTTVGRQPPFDEFVAYLEGLATVWVGDPVPDDHLLVLSTCGVDTNERHIVVARIAGQTYEDAYATEDEQVNRILSGTAEGLKVGAGIAVGLGMLLLVAWFVGGPRRSKGDGKDRGV